ncbi:hypothetical protein AKJ09_00614 [Labilithrix luteola]|uniref:Lipoprotein n=1 Tax=Labilithrix luteola TaxID=1391654 RepID=A0A0K1PK94_9BACT|nr:hypothetical protein [Labilithrix luteola]AKU93950.1 hypothetical protein AKJ09_00614 [Labilithrix luteola]
MRNSRRPLNVANLHGIGLALGLAAATSWLATTSGCAAGDEQIADVDSGAPVEPEPQGSFSEAGAEAAGFPYSDECTEETKQIYVLAADKGLYRFYPETLKFVLVGMVGCPTTSSTFSMAVDRRGTAWVEFQDGRLFIVDTRDARCLPTAFPPGRKGFETFGMGYALNAPDSTEETLFVAGDALAALDTNTFAFDVKGSLSFSRNELTSIGADLYGFSPFSGAITGYDKTTGAPKVTYRTTALGERVAFAFTQWAGDFWIFTGENTSTVTRYTPATDTSTVAVQNAGILIVGAGTSTCAPTTPVK